MLFPGSIVALIGPCTAGEMAISIMPFVLLTARFGRLRLARAIKSICPKRRSIARIALSYSFGEEGSVLMSSVHGSAEEHQICRRGGISDRCFIAPSRKYRTVVFSNADA